MIPAWVDGVLTPVEKLEVHRRGLRHKAVSVFTMWGDRVLLQRRALGKYHTPGLWSNTCCTHPLWNETPEACALRRLGDELGIVEARVTYRDHIEYRADVGGGLVEHEEVDVFVMEADGPVPLRPNPDEVMATRWIALDELDAEIAQRPGDFTPWLRIYLRDFSASIFAGAL